MANQKNDSIKLYNSYNQCVNKLNRYIGKVQKKAYKNPYNLSNPVLSRNPYSSQFFKRLLIDDKVVSIPSRLLVIKQIIKYYISSLIQFTIYILNGLCFFLSGMKYTASNNDIINEIYVIDTFILIDEILCKGEFEDKYFDGLYTILNKMDKQYVYLPVFYGLPSKDLISVYKVFCILKKSNKNIIAEFDLLHLSDYFNLLKFLILYPIEVVKMARPSKDNSIDMLFAEELIASLITPQFINYTRYLVGKRIAKLTNKKLNIISWFENQVIDRNLYRGIRDFSENSLIYGCQPFIYSPTQMNIHPTNDEAEAGVLADIILVNGTYYLDKIARGGLNIECKVGPSFRYKRLFQDGIDWNNKNLSLILLPYYHEDCNDVLKLCKNSYLSEYPVRVKFHPTASQKIKDIWGKRFPSCWTITSQSLYDLFEDTEIVFSTESGSVVEAATLGISVVILASQSSFTSNPMPEYGKGKLWDIAYNAIDLEECCHKLLSYRAENVDDIKQIAENYKNMFFTQPTEHSIIEAFHLAQQL